jgi:hypothetical protein
LIPVWVFVADLYTSTTISQVQALSPQAVNALVASDVSIYVPASAAPAAMPQASIVSPAPGTTVKPGQSIVLSGAASGGQSPYSYQWSSSADGLLGTGPTLNVSSLHPDVHNGHLQPNVITLLVTDGNAQTASDTVDVKVLLSVYLPMVIRE